MYKSLASYAGKEIIFGIRPEDIYDKLFTSMASLENTVKAVVEVVEPMGSEIFLYLMAGKSPLTARVGGTTNRKFIRIWTLYLTCLGPTFLIKIQKKP